MGNKRYFLRYFQMLFILMVLPFFTYSQNYDLPHDSLIAKHGIRKIRVVHNNCDSTLKAVGDGYLLDFYCFNKKHQLVKHKGRNVTYYYTYNSYGQLISQQEKWKIFTNAWWQGEKFQCNTFNKIPNTNKTIITEFIGKCRDCDSNRKEFMKQTLVYIDQYGRDTLINTIENNWYYAIKSDTGRISLRYKKIDNNTEELMFYNNFKKAFTKSDEQVLKTNDKGQIIDIYDPGSIYLCPRFLFEYKGDLLIRKLHVNCLGKIGNYESFKYYYRIKIKKK